jgi:cytoskeletal protein RodZ
VNELGQMLKEARLSKGLSLDDIHKETKIQKRYLEAIEEGNLDALPGHFYARAFVKSYAEIVGIPADSLLPHIQPETAISVPVEDQLPMRRGRQIKSTGQASRWLSRALLYMFAVLILFVIYIAVSEFDKKPKQAGEPTPSTSPVKPPLVEGKVGQGNPTQNQGNAAQPAAPATPAPTTGQPAAKPAPATLNFVGQEGNVFRYEVIGATDLTVKMTATGSCWTRVQKGGPNGQRLDEVTLTNGMSKQYSFGTEEAWIRMGSAPDVTIDVNGAPLDTSKMPRASQILSIVIKK